MNIADLILDLPVELACEIGGKWLCLIDVARLDSAFCHTAKRHILHESIFQSSSFVSDEILPNKRHVSEEDVIEWVWLRGIRSKTLFLDDNTNTRNFENYLHEFGWWVEYLSFSDFPNNFDGEAALIGKYCANLRSVVMWHCALTAMFLELIGACTKLASLKLVSVTINHDVDSDSAVAKIFRIKDCSMRFCDKNTEMAVLQRCRPEYLVKVQLCYCHAVQWDQFTSLRSLRSLGFGYDGLERETLQRIQVFMQCHWVVNLDLRNVHGINDTTLTQIIHAIDQLHSLNIDWNCVVTNGSLQSLVMHHSTTLKALYVSGCKRVTAAAVNHVVANCSRLSALSFLSCEGIDYAQLNHMTTLITNYPENENVWRTIQHGCNSVQYLHLYFDVYVHDRQFLSLKAAAEDMPALRVIHFSNLTHEQFREALVAIQFQRPSVQILHDSCYSWYALFDLPA